MAHCFSCYSILMSAIKDKIVWFLPYCGLMCYVCNKDIFGVKCHENGLIKI